MRKLWSALFLLMSICVIMNPKPLFSDESQSIKGLDFFNYAWNHNDEYEYVWLNINLSNNFNFKERYYKTKTENGRGCEIEFYPLEGQEIFSEEGYILEKASFAVELQRILNKIHAKIIVNVFYNKVDDKGEKTNFTRTITRESKINVLTIDFTQDPEFFTITNQPQQGVIAFKNSIL